MRLNVLDLAAERGGERLFSDVGFTLSSGECMVVKGPNGSGKSTLIRTIAGLLHADHGKVEVHAGDEKLPRAAEACHYLGHRNAMKRELSVHENLALWQNILGDFEGGRGIEPEEAATRMGLETLLHLPFGYLSAGQQRRMAMAKLLTAWRPVWLLDEPTAALDVQSEKLFTDLILEHMEKGGIVIAATHQPLGIDNCRELVMKGFEYREIDA